MSKTPEQIRFLEDSQADFETFLSQRKFSDCLAIIDNLGELGYETEALFLHQAYNRVWGAMTEQEQREWARKDNLREDMEAEEEDWRDINDRAGTYPH